MHKEYMQAISEMVTHKATSKLNKNSLKLVAPGEGKLKLQREIVFPRVESTDIIILTDSWQQCKLGHDSRR